MKALSIINPWAHLIMYHGKNIENRPRRTYYRGRFLVHVSKKITPDYTELLSRLMTCQPADKADLDVFNEWHIKPSELKIIESECGMIIGSVELYDCEFGIYRTQWGERGLWHWKLRNPVPLEKPVPARGSLGLWEYDGDLK